VKDKPTRRKHADLPRYEVRLTINGQPVLVAVPVRETLLDTLRRLEFTEVKDGCGSGECGVCAVQIDGVPANSCLVLTVTCDGADVRTAAGLGTVLAPSRLQTTMAAEGAVQCGFCMPAMICAVDPLQKRSAVSERDVREAMDGILCRCTGYVKPVRAISGALLRTLGRVRRLRCTDFQHPCGQALHRRRIRRQAGRVRKAAVHAGDASDGQAGPLHLRSDGGVSLQIGRAHV